MSPLTETVAMSGELRSDLLANFPISMYASCSYKSLVYHPL